jgi:hypothetical protein
LLLLRVLRLLHWPWRLGLLLLRLLCTLRLLRTLGRLRLFMLLLNALGAVVLPLGVALLIAPLVTLSVRRPHRADKKDAGGTGHLDEIHDGFYST